MQMIAPRDIYELADTVEAELLAQEGADLEQVSTFFNDFYLLIIIMTPMAKLVQETRDFS